MMDNAPLAHGNRLRTRVAPYAQALMLSCWVWAAWESVALGQRETEGAVHPQVAVRPAKPVQSENAAPDAVAPIAAPDVVSTRAGALWRGTIVELIPNDKVVIQLMTGDLREAPMDAVEYAGPAQGWPKAAAAQPADVGRNAPAAARGEETLLAVHADRMRLRLRGEQPGLTFFLYHGSNRTPFSYHRQPELRTEPSRVLPQFDRLCTAPCEVTLPVGNYRFGVSHKDLVPLLVPGSYELAAANTDVHAAYRSRAGTRAAGWVTMIFSGMAIFGAGIYLNQALEEDVRRDGRVAGGAAVLGAGFLGFLIGWVLSEAPDYVALAVEPSR